MAINLKNLFMQTAIVGVASLTSGGINAQTAPENITDPQFSPPMTVQEAQDIINKANRATNDLFIMGIVGTFNPTGKLNLNGGKIDIGIKKADCKKIIQDQSSIVDMKTYQVAQKTLIDTGQLTKESAEIQFRTQSNVLKAMRVQLPTLIGMCESLDAQP